MGRTFKRRAGPPYVITDGCIECGICERVCPYDAIFMSDDFEFVVDGEQCPGCHRCYDPCPVDVIVPNGRPTGGTGPSFQPALCVPRVVHDHR
ncbi:MAG: 4Fe-4S binding protein [Actinomycetota bacterium]|nr:4Fe-4S binding protein [Actinomycetota bacterium]